MARVIDSKQEEEKLRVTGGNYKRIDKLKVIWEDGSVSPTENLDDEHKIIYIPQTYLNRLSDEKEEVTEIDKIIHDIVLINKDSKKAYEKMENDLKDNKLKIDKCIYNLVDIFNKLKEQKDKLSDIGNGSGIDKELTKLKKEKERISKELSISEDDIRNYDKAISNISRLDEAIKRCNDDIKKIDKISSIVMPISLNLPESVKSLIESSIKTITEKADELWEDEKRTIITNLKSQLIEKNKEKNLSEEIAKKLSPKIEENESVKNLTKAIQDEEKKKRSFEIIDSNIKNEQEKFKRELDFLINSFLEYYKIRDEYAKEINGNLSLNNEDLSFCVKTPFRAEAFIKQIEDLSDKRSLKGQKNIINIDDFSDEWVEKENIKNLIEAYFNGEIRLIKNKTIENALRDIMGDWYNTTYRVSMDNDFIDDMSPGKKALVLLKMLISLAENKCPILIDQPEDDLDNRSIFDELIPFIKKKKIDRQIIIVTHNANVVLGGDAEEIIVANQEGKNTPNKKYKFEYRSGAIEDDQPYDKKSKYILEKQGIQQHICDILEGGKMAFDLRKNKYRI